MKTDTIFYQLFQEFPWIFFQLIQKEQTNLNAYEFIAPEIKQRSFRLDGLFTTREEYSDLPLYFQDAKEEGKLEQKLVMIPLLQELGLTIEQIAQRLEISENLVRENIKP